MVATSMKGLEGGKHGMQRRGRLTARSEGTQQSPAFFSNSVPASHTLMVCRSGYWQSTVENHSSCQAFLGVTGFLHLAQQVGVSFWLKFSILPNSEDRLLPREQGVQLI